MPLGAYCDIVTPFSQSIAFSGGLAGPEELKRTVVCFSLGLSPDRRVWRDSRERTPAEMAWQDSRAMGSGRTVGRGGVEVIHMDVESSHLVWLTGGLSYLFCSCLFSHGHSLFITLACERIGILFSRCINLAAFFLLMALHTEGRFCRTDHNTAFCLACLL